MNEWVRFFAAVTTAALLTWFTHWVSGAVEYPLGWGWSALIGAVVAVILWYGFDLWDALCVAADALTDWGR